MLVFHIIMKGCELKIRFLGNFNIYADLDLWRLVRILILFMEGGDFMVVGGAYLHREMGGAIFLGFPCIL